MKFLKKQIVFLLILLIVVCFSFGVTYSNFIFNSPEQRAVEIINSKLEYQTTINGIVSKEYNLVPGNNLLNIEIKSLNEIDTFYKLVYKAGYYDVVFYNTSINNRIGENNTVNVSVLVFNKLESNQIITFDVLGGYITNKVSDIKVTEDYNEIEKNINTGDIINVNGNDFYLLEVKADSIDLVSVNTYEGNEVTYSGASGYNNFVVSLNQFASSINLGNNLTTRTVNLKDIEKYTNSEVITYGNTKTYYIDTNDLYYPALLSYEKDVKINNRQRGNLIDRSQGISVEEVFEKAASITLRTFNVNEISFKDNVYENIFFNKNYYLSTRASKIYDSFVNYNVCKIESNKLKLVPLYDSNGYEFEISAPVKLFVNLNSKYNVINNLIQI